MSIECPPELLWRNIRGTPIWVQDGPPKRIAKHFRAQKESVNGGTTARSFRREVDCLLALNGSRHTPEVHGVNYEHQIIYMQYCGPNLEQTSNLPINWMTQVRQLGKDLKAVNVWYADLKLSNVCVLDGQIRLIDFGVACIPTEHRRIITPWMQDYIMQDITDRLIQLIESISPASRLIK
jgi:hypothetical protein